MTVNRFVLERAVPSDEKPADGRRDRVRCGPGRDRVVADRKDRVAGDCERLSR